MESNTKKDAYLKPEDNEKLTSENLLEQVLSTSKPVVSSTQGNNYDVQERPTELSSFGYVDYAGDDPSD